jgi:hypothetical protein
MNLFPNKFTIGGVQWSVEEPDIQDRNKLGTTSSLSSLIQVSKRVFEQGSDKLIDMPQDIRNETFFHELVHCIFGQTLGIDLSEEQVMGSSTLLYQFIKENYNLKDEYKNFTTEGTKSIS